MSLLQNAQLNSSPRITAVESHTQGEPTRIVVGGLPEFHETSAIGVRNRLEAEFDSVRRLLMMEPRGHRDMFGAFLFRPTRPDADLGVVYSHSEGFSNMCGHGSIGVGTFAVESGLVTGPYDSLAEIRHDDVDVRLDTPAGLVVVRVHVHDGKVTGATVSNVPAFVAEPHVTLDLDYPGVPAGGMRRSPSAAISSPW
jgi:proline racemase